VTQIRTGRTPLRIAFFGLPLAALLLDADGHDLVSVAICRREALGLRRARAWFGRRLQVLPDTDGTYAQKIAALKPDLVVSWFWTRKLPVEILRAPRLAAFGVHPSLLPRHRGPDPCFWAIDSGDRVTGVTAHLLEADYDTGATLAQKRVRILKHWDAWTLAKALDRPSLQVLRAVARKYGTRNPPVPVRQPRAGVTAAPEPSDDDLELDWSWSSERLLRRIRAAAPYPGAFTYLPSGGAFAVLRARRIERDGRARALHPGEMLHDADGLVIRTGDGLLRIERLRREADGVELEVPFPGLRD
jgi:methionyl-tRNA formyltransferase